MAPGASVRWDTQSGVSTGAIAMRSAFWLPLGIALAATAPANEVTVQNDSLTGGDAGTIQAGFVTNEKAASWLTTPCDGNIVAVQIFWESLFGNAPLSLEDSIDIYRSGTFPVPGDLAQEIGGPVLTDGVLNEYRYLDENDTIPLSVPVIANETFVVALTFAAAPDPTEGPSVVNDSDGIEPNRNAIYASLGGGNFQWFSNTALGVTGDWVVRAVVDCQSVPNEADVAVAMSADPPQYTAGAPLTYTITISNAGPSASPTTTIVDAFPPDFTDVSWTCDASGGATCAASGTGMIAATVNLPAGSQVVYTADGTVASGTFGTLTNGALAFVNAPSTDPDMTNNTATLDLEPAALDDTIFFDGFDD
jgi:uncharacterized repeat protein (TIGR01451 family)